MLGTARHGVWAYRYGDPPLFEPVFDAAPVTETALELHDPRGTAVIYRSTGTTDVVSLNRNRVPILWKSARFAVRRLDGLASGTWEPPGERDPPRPQAARASPPDAARASPPQAARASSPDATVVLRHVGRVVGRVARRKLRNATQQHQWFLGIRRRPADRLPGDDAGAWHTVVPPPDRSYADPFVLAHGGRTFVFFEVLDHASGVGSLAVGHLDDGGLTGIEPILPMPHHTSYPYVFRDGEDIYLIPETGDARRVDLFAAVDFPTGWERVATLIEGVNAVDATVLRHGGRYWMWVTIAVPGGRLYDETFLYSSDRLEAGWTPHPGNPVVSDARRARPAGRPFLHEGRLIRPSQSCAGRYGERVMFNEIEALTGDEYRERSRRCLGPEWTGGPNLAAHTYTFDDGWEATDGLRLFRRGPLGTARRRR